MPWFAVDYKKLNVGTLRDSYQIPQVNEVIDSLGDARNFSKFDTTSAYWQVEIAKEERNRGLPNIIDNFSSLVWCLIKNAPGTFQCAVEDIFSTIQWQLVLVYSNRIVIFSKNQEADIKHVRHVLILVLQCGSHYLVEEGWILIQHH